MSLFEARGQPGSWAPVVIVVIVIITTVVEVIMIVVVVVVVIIVIVIVVMIIEALGGMRKAKSGRSERLRRTFGEKSAERSLGRELGGTTCLTLLV